MECERFSLLLLEPGEYYFEDFSVYFTIAGTKPEVLIGRLKMCSKSLVFDPRDIAKPIIKIPFKECSAITKINENMEPLEESDVLLIECSQFVEMLAGNILAPYVFRHGYIKFKVKFNYAQIEDCLSQISQLHRASSLPVTDQNQMIVAIACGRQSRIKFDKMWLENFDEKIVLETIGNKITPLVVNPGRIVLSNLYLYFQPFNNVEKHRFIKVRLSNIKRIIRRRFLLQHVGLELYCKDENPVNHLYISLKTTGACDTVYNAILNQPELSLDESDQDIVTLQWQNGIISNYDYLLYINSMADRTFNDLTQYPVFPWVVADYTSSELDLNNLKTLRDLSKPIGALNPERLQRLQERYNEMPHPKFLYGSHYSTPGFVLFYLVRKYPHYMLCLQNGRFDHPDRMFNSVSDIWKNVLTNMSDFKELVPEFYDRQAGGDFLLNTLGIHFGYRHDGSRVGDVRLPPWATGPSDFVNKLREALECDYVSSQIHHWIDLIFGYKQTGVEADKANNNFYYLCYEGAIDLDAVQDWNQRHALEVQIMEFGQIPKQVFKKPHPSRTCSLIALEKKSQNLLHDKEDDNFRDAECTNKWTWSEIGMELQPRLCSQSHKNTVEAVVISKDSNTVFSVGRDSFLKMHNITNFKQERSVPLSTMAFSSIILLQDQITALIGCWDSTVLVYDIECGRIVDKLLMHEDVVSCIAWCYQKNQLITGSWDCTVRIWRCATPWVTIRLRSSLIAQLNHDSKIPCLTVSRKEDILVTGTEAGEVFVWSMDTFKITTRLSGHSGSVTDLQLSNGAERLISCSTDHLFKVYDLATGSQVYSKRLDEQLNCVLWDNQYVLLGGSHGSLFHWDLVKNTLVQKVQAHTDAIACITCNEDGSIVVTGGQDHRIVIWKSTSSQTKHAASGSKEAK